MQPYSLLYRGVQTSLSELASSSNPVHGGYKTLSCGDVIKGDFRSPNPWSYTIVDSRVHVGASSDYQSDKWVSSTVGTLIGECPAFVNTTLLADSARKLAFERLGEKVRGNLNLAVSIAEGGQTIKMLNLTRRFTDNLASMKRSYLKQVWSRFFASKNSRALPKYLKNWEKGVKLLPGAKRYYRSAPLTRGRIERITELGANGWLEYTYGWRPLVSDIYGLAQQTVGRVRNTDKISASGTQVVSERRVESQSSSYPPIVQTANGKVSVRVGATMSSGFDPGLSRFTTLNPLSVAWELIPYSFVVDWFYDIGNYMRSFEDSVLFRNQWINGYVSTLIVVNYDEQITGKTSGTSNYYFQSSSAKKKVTVFYREIENAWPSPTVPKFSIDLGSSRLLSAASLLRQLIK